MFETVQTFQSFLNCKPNFWFGLAKSGTETETVGSVLVQTQFRPVPNQTLVTLEPAVSCLQVLAITCGVYLQVFNLYLLQVQVHRLQVQVHKTKPAGHL